MCIKVKNLNGTADSNPPSGYLTWKEYWTVKKGYWPKYCSVYGCSEYAELGAHVKKVDSYDNDWYIVPMCRKHNNQHNETFIVDTSCLVKENYRK